MKKLIMLGISLVSLSSVFAANRPLHIAVKQLEHRYQCTIEFPQEVRNRKTNISDWGTLNEALNQVFYKENFSVSTKKGVTRVEVLDRAKNVLGDLPKRRIMPSTIEVNGQKAEVDGASLLVGFQKDMSKAQKAIALQGFGVNYDDKSLDRPFVLVQVKKGEKATDVREKMLKDSRLKPSYNYLVRPVNTAGIAVKTAQVVSTAQTVHIAEIDVNDPFYSQQWGHQYVKGHIGFMDQKNKSAKIVVLDTGLNLSHPDLDKNQISNRDFSDELVLDNDVNGHGTGVIGVIGAAWNNVGITGLTDTDIISIKVFDN